jgi:hypothetical protein
MEAGGQLDSVQNYDRYHDAENAQKLAIVFRNKRLNAFTYEIVHRIEPGIRVHPNGRFWVSLRVVFQRVSLARALRLHHYALYYQ